VHRVYGTFADHLRYPSARNAVDLVGDWFGRGRYSDFEEAIHLNRLSAYADRIGFDGLLLRSAPGYFSGPTLHRLVLEARAAGFVRVDCPGSSGRYVGYLRPAAKPQTAGAEPK
jgi:hypothetical protein